MDNRQKAIFLDELSKNPTTRAASIGDDGKPIPAGALHDEFMRRLTDMVEANELTTGVLTELEKLRAKSERRTMDRGMQRGMQK